MDLSGKFSSIAPGTCSKERKAFVCQKICKHRFFSLGHVLLVICFVAPHSFGQLSKNVLRTLPNAFHSVKQITSNFVDKEKISPGGFMFSREKKHPENQLNRSPHTEIRLPDLRSIQYKLKVYFSSAQSLTGILVFVLLLLVSRLYYGNRKLLAREIAARQAKAAIEKELFGNQGRIADLEEKLKFTKQTEQMRLGMELHDGLAGMLASIKLQLETEYGNTVNGEQKKRISGITRLVESAYQHTRWKSHEWFKAGKESIEQSFSNRISSLVDQSLPAENYVKNVIIDDNALAHVTSHTKIELLRIIQEAVTNVVKHANARKINILVYEEATTLVIHIKDNGKGFDPDRKNRGIGLSSIKTRVMELKGQLDIITGKQGTELIVEIPVSQVFIV